jgi:hypothetical protein
MLPGKEGGERSHSRDSEPDWSRDTIPSLSSSYPLAPCRSGEACPCHSAGLPVDVLGIGGIGHRPVGDVQGLTAGGGAWLPTAGAALALAHVEVLQDAGR